MKKFLLQITAILAVFTGIAAGQSGAVKIYTVPEGIAFTVDGEFYRSAATAVWPAGTKHILSANPVQEALNVKTHWTFGSWQFAGGTLPGGVTVTVTADPSIKEFWSNWNVEHALSLNYSACDPNIPCVSPGTIYVNDAAYTGDADIYFNAGASVKLMAVPAAGYVFTGWDPVKNQVIT